MKKIVSKLSYLIISGLLIADAASAQLVNCGRTGQTDCQVNDLIFIVERIINFLLSWAWIVSIFYIMWAGYNMMFSAGDSEALQTAKDKFRHAVIGFVLIMVSYILVNWIVSLFSGPSEARSGAFDFYRNFIQP